MAMLKVADLGAGRAGAEAYVNPEHVVKAVPGGDGGFILHLSDQSTMQTDKAGLLGLLSPGEAVPSGGALKHYDDGPLGSARRGG